MTTHREMVQGYQLNLKLWREYTARLSHQELLSANNILIGSVCSRISTQAMEYHIRLVQEVLSRRKGNDGN
jgi:hypothetical protein